MLRERCNVRSIRDALLKAEFMLIILQIILILSFAQQVILVVASWLFSIWTQNHEKTLEQHA